MRSVAACLLAAAALLAVLLAPPAAAAEDPVTAAAQRTATEVSLSFVTSTVMDIPGTGKLVQTEVVEKFAWAIRMKQETVFHGVRETATVIGRLEAGNFVVYVKSPSLFTGQLPPGRTWMRFGSRQSAAKRLGYDILSDTLSDTRMSFDPLRFAIVKATRLGRNRIGGRSTTRYQVTVDVHKAGGYIPPYGDLIKMIERNTGSRLSRLKQDVWVDTAGRLARLRVSYPAVVDKKLTAVRTTITVTSYAPPKPIIPPPADTVVAAAP